jgi:Cu+-exporting ATPase
VFVPAVLAAAVLTLAGWLLAGLGHPGGTAPAVSAGLAVLIIACPCALGLATPAALVAACGRGAQLGIFIKGYQALESSRAVDTVVLDKTGTVTTGQMTLTRLRPAADVTRAVLTVAADAIRLSRATFRTIRRNLAWAFGYNLGALPLAALGLLNPIVASAAMTLSSVFVVWNSLRLGKFKAGSY